jgi:hypothetical protein
MESGAWSDWYTRSATLAGMRHDLPSLMTPGSSRKRRRTKAELQDHAVASSFNV